MTNTDFLPSFSSIGPIRVSTERVDGHPAYDALLREAHATGCCPVWLTDTATLEPPDDPSAAIATIGHTDPATVLAAH